mgnify:CR=1 FL=1
MKNTLKYIGILLAVFLVSCEAIDDSNFPSNRNSGWVEFETASSQVLSDVGTVTIPVEYNVPINREDVTVSYDVAVVEGEAPGAVTGSFTTIVPADTRDLSIMYEVDPTISSNYTLSFTITGTSNPDVIVGLDGDNPIVHTLEVCFGELPLSWTGNAFFDGGSDPVNTFDMTLTPTGNPGEYEIDTAWGPNYVAALTGNPAFEGQFLYEGILTINPDNTISIVGLDTGLFPGTVPAADSTSGNVFDPCTRELRYTLSQALFTGDFVVNVELSAND